MKTTVLVLMCVVLSGITFGQTKEGKELGEVTFSPPRFTGVANASLVMAEKKFATIEEFLQNNVSYPEKDIKNFNQGTEVIKFVVTPTGELTDISIVNEVSPEISEEVIRVLKTTNGQWIPGEENGEPVARDYGDVAVVFKINGSRFQSSFKELGMKYFTKGGELFLTRNNPKKALQYYDKGIVYLPNDEGLLLMRGLARYNAGDKNGAIRDWERIKTTGGSVSPEYLRTLIEMDGYEEMAAVLN